MPPPESGDRPESVSLPAEPEAHPPPLPGVNLTLDRAVYAPGDTLHLRLQNESENPLGYNLCMHAAERWTGQQWDMTERSRLDCPAILYHLPRDSAVVLLERVTPEWPPGTYRIWTQVESGAERYTLSTPTFEVLRE